MNIYDLDKKNSENVSEQQKEIRLTSEPKQGVIYVRHSNKDDYQETSLINYCQNNNIDIVDQFIDDSSDTNQPELQRMLHSLKPSMCVVCASMNRLSRNVKDVLKIFDTINKSNASLISLDMSNVPLEPIHYMILNDLYNNMLQPAEA